MNIWDFFKFFPMFETFFGNKNLYLEKKELLFYQKMNTEETQRIDFYRQQLAHFQVFKFSGLHRDVLNLAIDVLHKIVNFPFNFTYFDYSSEPKLNETSIIIFPEGVVPLILDFEFYALLLQFYLGCKSNQSLRKSTSIST